MAEKRLFVRTASGLVRIIGPFAAMVFGVHCISLSSSGLIPYAWIPWLWPGSDLIAVLTISMLLCLLHATTYSQIGSIYPRSGGDYVLGSRVINPTLQFGASFMFIIFTSLTAGALIAWIPSSVLPSFFWSWGVIFNSPQSLAWADWIVTPIGVLTVGLIFVVVTYICMIMPTRTVVRILNLGFFLGMLAWVLMWISYAMCPSHEAFVAAWNRFSPVTYEKVIPLAQENGLTYGVTPWWLMTMAGMIMGFWVYYGYYIPNFFAGELKEAPKTLIIGTWSSLLVTWGVFTLGAALMYPRLMSLEWMAAEGYLYYNVKAVWALPFSTYYANILWPNPIPVFIIMFGFVYTLVNLAMTYFFYNSRILFAMAFDRALPEAIAYVHPKLRSPVTAMTLCAVFAAIGVGLSVYTVIFVQYNFVLYCTLVQLIPVTGAILFPFLRKDQFERAPSLVKFRVGPIPGITLIGIGTLGYLLWMIISTYLFPAVGGLISWLTVGWFIGFFVTGIIIFRLMRWYRLRKEGLDINLAYKEIPPL